MHNYDKDSDKRSMTYGSKSFLWYKNADAVHGVRY